MNLKKILFIEPFLKGSHKYFLENLCERSQHDILVSSKNGVFWKWKFLESSICNELPLDHGFDIIFGSNMLDLSSWAGLNRNSIGDAKLALYFHENQLTYPENVKEKNKNEFFGFQNLTSAFCADKLFFNSEYHLDSFVSAGRKLSQKLPDSIPEVLLDGILKKSQILPVGISIEKLQSYKAESQNSCPVILWNHRWEFDKNPELFLRTLIELHQERLEFSLIMLGSAPKKLLPIFDEAKSVLESKIIQWGRVESLEEYGKLLWKADILPVTSFHDFFGISVLESVACETIPLLPKRCAYPEHFKVDLYKDLYYETDLDFKNRLRDMILNFEKLKSKSRKLSKIPERYSWDRIVTRFDQIVSEI